MCLAAIGKSSFASSIWRPSLESASKARIYLSRTAFLQAYWHTPQVPDQRLRASG
jgi:hypothetical protein